MWDANRLLPEHRPLWSSFIAICLLVLLKFAAAPSYTRITESYPLRHASNSYSLSVATNSKTASPALLPTIEERPTVVPLTVRPQAIVLSLSPPFPLSAHVTSNWKFPSDLLYPSTTTV